MSKEVPGIDSIFCAAIELGSAADRASYLDQACGGDVKLRRRLEILLDAHFRAGSFLESPAPALNATINQPISAEPGMIIGPYKLLQQIGEGGMGVVYMAEQTEPVERRVALKIIKPGMDSRQVIARFEAERQALSLMDHPNIAKVLDAGTTGPASGCPGRPYFVMELVKGVPITVYCDEKHLTVRQRLELLLPVCQAVQHAHQKGIIHRDIKPSNVMVALYDGQPVPKVIDFGVAKATESRLTDKTVFTEFGQVVGTMEYMSPEQAELNQLDVDTRSDIYSLGVLLYELLTGTTPLERKRLSAAAFDEMLRIIREEEPPKPSTRLSTANEVASIAANRGLEPKKLSGLVRGELDWIVMKALEKDRSRRYETANGLAMDLSRYLADEAVQACPPSATYRFRKFARRNRAALTTVVLVSAALVLGTVASTWQAVRATRAENLADARLTAETQARQAADEARAAEIKQRKAAESDRAEANKQRSAAEVNHRKAKAAVDKYFTLVSENKLFDVPGLESLRKELLEAALEFYEGAALERTSDAAVLIDAAVTQLRLSSIYLALNRIDDFIVAIRRALDVVDRLGRDHPNSGEHERKLAGFWQGMRWTKTGMRAPRDTLGALQTMLRLEATWTQLAQKYPSDVAFQSDLGYVRSMLGAGLEQAGRKNDATTWFRKGVVIGEKLVETEPTVPKYRADLAVGSLLLARSLIAETHSDEALKLTRKAIQLDEELLAESPKVPAYRAHLAVGLRDLADQIAPTQPQNAKDAYGRAIELTESLIREFPEHRGFVENWGHAVTSSALFNNSLADLSQVEAAIKNVTELFEAQIKAGTKEPWVRDQLARFYEGVAKRLPQNMEFAPTQADLFRLRVRQLEVITRELPDDTDYRESLGHALRFLGGATASVGSLEESMQCFQRAADAFESLASADIAQRDGFHSAFQADSLAQVAALRTAVGGNTPEVIDTARHSLEVSESLVRDFPNKADYRKTMSWSAQLLAQNLAAAGQPDEAEQVLRKALKVLEKAGDNDAVGSAYQALGDLYKNEGRLSEAIEARRTVVDAWEKVAKKANAHDNRWRLGGAYDHLGEVLKQANEPEEAEAALLKAVALWEKLATETDERDHRWHLACADEQLAGLLRQANRAEEGEALYLKAGALWEGLVREDPNSADYRLHQQWNRSWLGETYNNMAWKLVASSNAEPGSRDRALDLARKAVDLSPSDAPCFNTLGVAYYRAGRWEDAIGSLAKAEELAPEKTLAFNGFFLAMAHEKLGHKDEARKWFEQAVEWMEKHAPQNEELLRFRREAEDLLDGKPAVDANSTIRE